MKKITLQWVFSKSFSLNIFLVTENESTHTAMEFKKSDDLEHSIMKQSQLNGPIKYQNKNTKAGTAMFFTQVKK